MSAIEGLLPVIPTPFLDGAYDQSSMRRFLEYFLPWLDGYTLLGSTGEAPSLSNAERMRIAESVLEMTPKDKTAVIGVSHTSLQDTLELARHAEAIGAKAVLCAAPYYFTNEPDGMFGYLKALDDVIGIDLVLYDNPVATGTRLDPAVVTDWAGKLDHLHTVKLTDHDLSKVGTWHEAGLAVIAGDDPIAFRYLAEGVDGAMMIVPCLFPEAFAEVWRLVRSGRRDQAYEVFADRILPLTHVFGIGDEIATSKVVLQMMGLFTSAEVLPPLVAASDSRRSLVELGARVAMRAPAGG